MKYESAKSLKGNIGVSHDSQEEADNQAAKMDASKCYDCYNCNDCYGCYKCYDCYNCKCCNDCNGCYDCNGCKHCNDCKHCSYCKYCKYCKYCYDCNDCNECNGCLKWTAHEVSNLLSLNGLIWPVSISKTHMQIGCQNHSHTSWADFTESQIAKMESRALDFWIINKSMLMSLCEMQSKLQ